MIDRTLALLKTWLSQADIPERLKSAMEYSLFAGGKRIRAQLVYASGLALGAPLSRLDYAAAAIECIHTYSLIHDDLPAMDNDELRRGKPTSHIQFDEATAILAGDALHTMAFELISCTGSTLTDSQARQITQKLAVNSGSIGMVGGQMLDIQATDNSLELVDLEAIHRRKTGALIRASVICGALCADQPSISQLEALNQYADAIGLAFQVVDDILDIESSTELLGKPSGSDQSLGKSTYPAIIGLEESKKLAQNLLEEAIASLAAIGDNTDPLHSIAVRIVNRSH